MRHLARVHSASEHGRSERKELTRFCTHCAELFDAPAGRAATPARGRVCGSCGLGVILTCASATLSEPGAAFLVVTADLRVSAASRQAEALLAIPDGSYGRPLLSVLTSPAGVGEFVLQSGRRRFAEAGAQLRVPFLPASRRAAEYSPSP